MFHQHNCPACGSTNLVKKGATHYGKARLKCKHCLRQFVQYRTYAPLSNDCKRRIELLLAERIALAAICRVMEIEPHQLYNYVEELYKEIPQDLACQIPSYVTDIELGMIDTEADELWSLVGCKANQQWLWVALDGATRQVIALFVDNRGAEGALGLWQAMPEKYCPKACFYTHDWSAYKQIIPAYQHRHSKQKKDTNPVERFFCSLPQRCSRIFRS